MNLSSLTHSSFSSSGGLIVESFVCGPLQTNLYLVIDPEAQEAIVIDPSIETDEALQRAMELRAQGIRFTAIWNTHGHFDHVYDNACWKKEFGVPIYAHPADAFFLEQLREQSIWFGLPAPEVTNADFPLSEGAQLSVGSFTATQLELPGHSPGSIGFYFESEVFCIQGDVLFEGSVGRTDLPGCSAADLAKSIRRLFALPGETVIFTGHGGSTNIKDEVEGNEIAADLIAHYKE